MCSALCNNILSTVCCHHFIIEKLEEKWMVTMGSLTALDVTQGCSKKDDAKAKARGS